MKGRKGFIPGNPGGPGNPFAAEVGKLRRELFAAVKTGDVAAIVRRLVEDAKGGNSRAGALLLAYLIGKPVQHITADVTGTALTPDQMRSRLDELLGVVVEVEAQPPPKTIEKSA